MLGGDGSGSTPAGEFIAPLAGPADGVRGVMVISLNPQRPFDSAYRKFAMLLADAVASALDGALRRSVELGEYRRISEALQASMLKPFSDLPTVAARYLPAVGNLAVGGDWYDVIDLGEGRRGIIVGDCVGHGLEAATVMAQVRSAARSLILEGHDPARVLDGLDTFAAALDGARYASVVCAVFDRSRQTLTYSRAGHPPPLLLSPNGSTWLDSAGGPPLTISDPHPRSNTTIDVTHEDVIVLYTDGLIERRGESLDVGLQRLMDAASAMFGFTVQTMADRLLRVLSPETTRDDVVLVVKHL